MSRKKFYDDGSYVEYLDVEGVRYVEGGYSILITVVVGRLWGDRIIISYEIDKWDVWPEGSSDLIDENKRREIVEKVKMFYGKRCREATPEERKINEELTRKAAEKAGKLILYDDSTLDMKDSESIEYAEDGYSITVKFGYKAGLFSDKVIIKSPVTIWDVWPEGSSGLIKASKRRDIIKKIMKWSKQKFWPSEVIEK